MTARGAEARAAPRRIAELDVADRAAIPASAEQFLDQLPGPVHVHVPGSDRSRRRAWVTLLHGNEPSGLRALHGWLRAGRIPATDLHAFVLSVDAARSDGHFRYRMLPGQRDLNRCFAEPFADAQGELARELLAALRALAPESIADVHNTSRPATPYCVAEREDARHLALGSVFAPRFIVSRIRLGTLAEAFDSIPIVTFESGGFGTPAADRAAADGLERYASAASVLELSPLAAPSHVLRHPVRVELAPGMRAAYANAHVATADVTLRADIDRFVFEPVKAGELLGWVRNTGVEVLRAQAEDGCDVTRELFKVHGDRLLARGPLELLMVMTDAEGARLDCLFYAVPRA